MTAYSKFLEFLDEAGIEYVEDELSDGDIDIEIEGDIGLMYFTFDKNGSIESYDAHCHYC